MGRLDVGVASELIVVAHGGLEGGSLLGVTVVDVLRRGRCGTEDRREVSEGDWRVLQESHPPGDDGSQVVPVDDDIRVSEAPHERRTCLRCPLGLPPGDGSRDSKPGDCRRNDVEGGSGGVRGRSELVHDSSELGRAAGPSVQQQQGASVGSVRFMVEKMQVVAVDRRRELGDRVQAVFLSAPVELIPPVVSEFLAVCHGHPRLPIVGIRRFRPHGGIEPGAQPRQPILGNAEGEGTDERGFLFHVLHVKGLRGHLLSAKSGRGLGRESGRGEERSRVGWCVDRLRPPRFTARLLVGATVS